MREETVKRRMPAHVLIERILRIMTLLILVCLSIGLPLFIVSRASGYSDSSVARLGAYILTIGVGLAAMRIFIWIVEEIVGRGLESMANQDIKRNLLQHLTRLVFFRWRQREISITVRIYSVRRRV